MIKKRFCCKLISPFVISSILVLPFAASASVYRWTDSSGTIHYSDKPKKGAKKIKVKEIPTYSAPDIPVVSDSQDQQKAGDRQSYKRLAIVAPADQETIRQVEGKVFVRIKIDPPLQKGDSLQLLLDGEVYAKSSVADGFQMTGVDRGSHQLSVQVLDDSGRVLKASDPVTIFMHQPRVNMRRPRAELKPLNPPLLSLSNLLGLLDPNARKNDRVTIRYQ